MARNQTDIEIVGRCESCGCLIRRDLWEGKWLFGSRYAGADPDCEHSHPSLRDEDEPGDWKEPGSTVNQNEPENFLSENAQLKWRMKMKKTFITERFYKKITWKSFERIKPGSLFLGNDEKVYLKPVQDPDHHLDGIVIRMDDGGIIHFSHVVDQ